jgi:hypothetical protein
VRPRELNPAISEALKEIIQRAMAKEPEQRFPSMSALRLALSNLESRSHSLRTPSRSRLPLAGPIGVRWRFVALASGAALLAAAALVSVLAGLLASSGRGLQLSTGERAAASVGLGAAVGLVLLALWRFQRQTWRDTAKLSDWLPKLRYPVLTAIVIYGLASFGQRFAENVLVNVPRGVLPELAPRQAWPGWGALLAALGLLGAAAAALHQSWWQPMRSSLRWAWGAALSAAVALGVFAFARSGASSLTARAPALRLPSPRSSSRSYPRAPRRRRRRPPRPSSPPTQARTRARRVTASMAACW